MDVCLLDIRLLLDTIPNLKCTALVIRAVGARDKLLILSLEREPSLEVILLGGCIVQPPGHNGDYPVRETQALVECLGIGDHLIKRLPGLLRIRQEELLDLLELMNTENTPCIPTVASGFSPVAGRVTGIFNRNVLRSEPFVGVKSRNGLFRGRDEVLVVLTIDNLVQLLVELLQLRSLCHVVLQHELRRLQRGVAALCQELEAVVDQSLIKENTPLAQEVTSVADDLYAPVRIVAIDPSKHFVVRQAVPLLDRHTLGGPCSLDGVVVLVIADWDGLVYDVTDGIYFGLEGSLLLGRSLR